MPKQSRIEPIHIPANEWLREDGPPRGVQEGVDYGVECVIIRYSTDTIGEGPELHVHPYDEIFHITQGRAEFTVGDRKFIAAEGSLVVGPANVPHGYKNLGPGRLDSVDVHLSPEWIQYDLTGASCALGSQKVSVPAL